MDTNLGNTPGAVTSADQKAAGDAEIAAGRLTKEQVAGWLQPSTTPAPSFDDGSGFTSEQQAKMLAWAIEDGRLTAEQAAGTTPAGKPPVSAPADGGATTDFTAAQLKILADDAVRAGKLTRTEADAALAADTTASSAAPSAVDAHLVGMDYHPAAPNEFELPPMIGADEKWTPDAQKASDTARGWLSTAKLDRAMGSALAANAEQTFQHLKGMDETGRQLWAAGQRAQLDRMGFTPERIALARSLVREIEAKSPGLEAFLVRTNVGNDARVVAQLVLHAERLNSRAKK